MEELGARIEPAEVPMDLPLTPMELNLGLWRVADFRVEPHGIFIRGYIHVGTK